MQHCQRFRTEHTGIASLVVEPVIALCHLPGDHHGDLAATQRQIARIKAVDICVGLASSDLLLLEDLPSIDIGLD